MEFDAARFRTDANYRKQFADANRASLDALTKDMEERRKLHEASDEYLDNLRAANQQQQKQREMDEVDLDDFYVSRGFHSRPQQPQPPASATMPAESSKAWNEWLRREVKYLLWNEKHGAMAQVAEVMGDQRNQLIDELEKVISELRGEIAELRAAMVLKDLG